jgi:putative glutamine amidotransferase
VNALHNQSINQLGKDIIVSATEPNGVVQAIEKRGHYFFLGVQWHPEYMPQSEVQQGLFRGLVDCARESRAGVNSG